MQRSSVDVARIKFAKRAFDPMARLAIFIVYAWFGALKALGISPAEPLVHALHGRMIGFVPFDGFSRGFAWFEVLIGVLFLFPKATRIVIPLLLVHMGMTMLPLLFLPELTWQSAFVPTLVGQYIIKNLVIVACAIGIVGHLHTRRRQAT